MSEPENNTRKLLRALLSGAQNVENALQQLLLQRTIDTAIGAQLDVLGRIVGQRRHGLDDDTYRRRIRARIRTNRSRGTVNDILWISDLVVYDDDGTFRIHHAGNASLAIHADGAAVTNQVADTWISFLDSARVNDFEIALA